MLTWVRDAISFVKEADQKDASGFLPNRTDFLLAAVLGVALAAVCLMAALKVDPVLFQLEEGRDVWLDGDIDRIFSVETSRDTRHASRNSIHPLYSLFTFPPVWFLRAAVDLSDVNAVKTFHSAVAGVWFASFFLLLRIFGCRLSDALIFTAVAATSASAIMWFVVPESFALGSLSILPALALCAAPIRRLTATPFAIAGALALSITVTNFMVALLATHLRWPWRKAAMISLASLFIVVALAAGQKLIFPKSQFPLEALGRESKFILTEHSGGPLHISKSFFFHTMVMPKIDTRKNRRMDGWDRTTVQKSGIGSAGRWGMVAAATWAALMALGVYGLITSSGFIVVRLVLALGVAGQLLLHLLYGYETFLFSLHFLPLLVAIAAWGARTRIRPLVLALAALFSVSALLNNVAQRELAYDHVRLYHTLRPPVVPLN